ncbi:unnamed protein product, partial [Allacma fusca]
MSDIGSESDITAAKITRCGTSYGTPTKAALKDYPPMSSQIESPPISA